LTALIAAFLLAHFEAAWGWWVAWTVLVLAGGFRR
jgi:hypothetical protein